MVDVHLIEIFKLSLDTCPVIILISIILSQFDDSRNHLKMNTIVSFKSNLFPV